MEVDHILTHNDVRNAITIISNLAVQIIGCQPLCVTQSPLWKYTSLVCVCVFTTIKSAFIKTIQPIWACRSNSHKALRENACHSQVRTLRPAKWNQGCSSGQTAPFAEPVSDWWRVARAPTKPEEKAERRGRERWGSTLRSGDYLHGICSSAFWLVNVLDLTYTELYYKQWFYMVSTPGTYMNEYETCLCTC